MQPPRRLVLNSTDRGQQFISTFTLSPAGSGTRVEPEMDLARPGGLPGLLLPLIANLLIKPDVAKGPGTRMALLEAKN